MSYDDLPTWEELVNATNWLADGCPVVRKFNSTEVYVTTLLKLTRRLPKYLPHYAYGSEEWKAEMNRLREAGLTS